MSIFNMRKDYTNQRFNYITVLEFHYSKNEKSYWKCRCDCGKEYTTYVYSVTKGLSKSCGCMRKQLIAKSSKHPNGAAIIKAAYAGHLDKAKVRNYQSHLSLEEYTQIGKRPCHYCGIMSKRRNRCTQEVIEFNSIDRLNNEPFYKLDNSVACCFVCQKVKGALSFNSFKEHIIKIYNYLERII